jgi:concanavalin A-like lectin/glucanase superfamily protein
VLAACGFHAQAQHGDAAGSAVVDAPADSSIDGPPPPSSPRKLVVTNPTAMALSSFRLYVPLDAFSVDYNAVTDPTTQLRFHDVAQNMDLQFEVDHWNRAGESGVWVKTLNLPAGVSSDVLMYFGPNVGGISRPTQVWSNFELVDHMEAALTNSASTIYEGNGVNVTTMPGQIGGAQHFVGTGDEQIDFTASNQLFDGWSTFSLEFWIYADYAAASDLGAEQPKIMDKGGGLALGRFYADNGTLDLQIDLHYSGSNNDVYLPVPITPRTWTYVAYTSSGSKVAAFANGMLVGSQNLTGGSQNMPANQLGYFLGDPATPMAGSIDELRIDQVARVPEYFAMQYAAMTRTAVTFVDP